jgi:signal transduction histidine kinase
VSVNVRNWSAVGLSAAWLILAVAGHFSIVDHYDPAAKAALETAVVLVGSLVAYLAVGRFRRSGQVSDLLVVVGIALLAWIYSLFIVIPSLFSSNPIGSGYPPEVWGALITRIIAALFFVGAILLRRDRPGLEPLLEGRRANWIFPVATSVATVAMVLGHTSTREGIFGHAGAESIASSYTTLFGAIAFVVAAWLLAVHSRTEADEFLGWLSTGCVFATFSLLTGIYFPFQAVGWIRPSDLLRAAAVATWAVGSVQEIRSYWSRIATSAQRESRRAVAIDLHDGLAQELALLATYLHATPDVRSGEQWHHDAQNTADRALAEARRTIVALSSDTPSLLDADLRLTAETVVGDDVDVTVEVSSHSLFALRDPLQRESIVRIVREAVTNAVRHGQAGSITIQLSGTKEAPEIRVVDDGVGFDPDDLLDPGRLGIVGMRERATTIGATLDVQSAPGQGTTVELVWR